MRLLVFLTKGFETIEFSVFIDVMGWARTDFGCKVDVVTCGLNRRVVSSFNVPVMVDKTIDEVSADEYDALAIPGGFEEFGFYEEAYHEKLMDLIRRFDANLLALEIVAPVTVMIEIADREPDRTDEMWTQIGVHLSHFIEIYGMK